MSRNAISANPEHYIFKIFRGSMPPDPLGGLKQFFLAAAWLKNFFRIDSPPPKQKILDRTLYGDSSSSKKLNGHQGLESMSLLGALISLLKHMS